MQTLLNRAMLNSKIRKWKLLIFKNSMPMCFGVISTTGVRGRDGEGMGSSVQGPTGRDGLTRGARCALLTGPRTGIEARKTIATLHAASLSVNKKTGTRCDKRNTAGKEIVATLGRHRQPRNMPTRTNTTACK